MSTELTNIENFYGTNPADYENISYEMLSSPKQTFIKDGREIDGIEILYNMARTGKIDPWDIDLADLADKYFLEIAKLKTVNLKNTSRAFLFLSVLLRLKSNVLDGIETDMIFNDPEEDEGYPFTEPDSDPNIDPVTINRNNVISLDEALVRRTSLRANRKRVVTLKDIIRQLEFYEQLDKKMELKNKLERQRTRVRSYARFSSKDIVNMYNEDFIKITLPKMRTNLDRIFESEEKVELETLTLLGFSKTTAYLALLFIVADSDYDITQNKFYDKLYIEKYNGKSEKSKELAEATV